MMWSASNCSLLIAILYTFAHLLVWYPNPNPDHLVFFQLGYISKCFHSFQHLATISRMKHRLSKIYSNIASLSPRYILCIYIYIYIHSMYTQSLQIQNCTKWWIGYIHLQCWRVQIVVLKLAQRKRQSSNHPLSSPFLRPCFLKIILGKTKKDSPNYRHWWITFSQGLPSLIDASPFVLSI